MLESTFYNLLNSIMNLTEDEAKDFLNSYNDFFDALLTNQELINEIKRQMRLEGLNATTGIEKKEALLESMRGLKNGPIKLIKEQEEIYNKVLNITSQLYDKALEDINRETTVVSVELCHENAKLPTYAHKDDAGFDFYLPEDFTIKAHEYGKIAKTGLKMAIPTGYELQIRPRSGNSVKTTLRISNAPGTIDCGYCDEIGIICDNIGDEDITFKAGDRIAQGVLNVVPRGIFNQVSDILIVAGSNRQGGYGSSGQ